MIDSKSIITFYINIGGESVGCGSIGDRVLVHSRQYPSHSQCAPIATKVICIWVSHTIYSNGNAE